MKTKFKILCIVAILLLGFSCSKSDIEKGIDCVSESLFVKLKHTADATNAKTINYSVEYTGSYTLKSVKWTFGDGTPSVVGTSVSHTYTTAGTYTVKADVTIQNGKSTCTSSPTRSVTVN